MVKLFAAGFVTIGEFVASIAIVLSLSTERYPRFQ
tara:strand:- start:977 stop:1081 length:105 start_codon:yes stop_codon:yes gene_type:complete